MATNRGVAYMKPGVVEVQSIDFRKLGRPDTMGAERIDHGVILKIISTNICVRPAYGPRSDDGAVGADPRTRDHRRGDRGRAGC